MTATPLALDFGPVVAGVAALGRITVGNAGSAPMSAPQVELLAGSAPDFAIAQNLCTQTLAPGEHCDIRLQVVATQAAALAATLQIDSDEAGSLAIPLSAEGLASGALVLAAAEGSQTDFGGVNVGSNLQASFELANPTTSPSGPLTMYLANPAFQIIDPVAASDCAAGTSLAPAATCSVHVAFTPTERGPVDAALVVRSDALGSTSLALSGQGRIAGVLALSTPSVDFQGVVLGASGQAPVNVQNQGDDPLTIASVALAGDARGEFSIASSECAAQQVLAAGQSCSVVLQFQPSVAADESSAQLVVTSAEAGSQAADLRGKGLLPGALVIEPVDDSPTDFGPVLVNTSAVHVFRVSNPGAEPSGEVTLTGSNAFSVLPGNDGECQQGVTSLANGESCSFRVSLTPTDRSAQTGAITASSPLAGNTTLALTGQGIVPAQLAVQQQQLNFSRVVLGAPARATVTISNQGDQPLTPPAVTVVNPAGGAASGFSVDSACTSALAYGQSCDITVTFNPSAPGSYSMRLQIVTDASQSSTLLTGTAVAPGQLVLSAGNGGSSFGDVPINAMRSLSFSVTNPGGIAAGQLTINSNQAQFVVNPGSCGMAMGAGLVDGAACQFSVAFTPVSSDALTATISVRSATAGESSLALSGRGRKPAALSGSGTFSFTTNIVGQNSANRAWMLTNTGDLPTGALSVTASSGDVVFANNTCTGNLAAGASCGMNVAFHPLAAGARSATLTVHDASGATPDAVLSVTGTGQALPAVGQPCGADSSCAAGGTCENSSNGTSRVCCGADCTGAQVCSQSRNFTACELPTVAGGARCAAGTNTCAAGFSCTAGVCCQSNCNGPCDTCGADGSCVAVAAGQPGRCAPLVCSGATRQCQCEPNEFEAAVNWAQLMASASEVQLADVNADQRADLVLRIGGTIQVALSNGTSFGAPTQWSTWGTSFDFHLADVDGDHKADLVGRSGNDVQVGISTGSPSTGFAQSTHWTSWDPAFDMQFADVNGDGAADIVGRKGNDVEAGLSTGTSFAGSTRWTSWDPAFDMQFADVDGDGDADIVGRSGNDVEVGLSTRANFALSTNWTSWSPNFDMHFADVDGNGSADIVGRNGTDVEVGLSTGTSFAMSTRWATWSANLSQLLGDVNKDAHADLVGLSGTTVQVGISCAN